MEMRFEMSFYQIIMDAQEQCYQALIDAFDQGIKYTIVNINESVTIGRDENGKLRYNGK